MRQREAINSLDGLGDEFMLTMKDLAAILGGINEKTAASRCADGTIPGLVRITAPGAKRSILLISVGDLRAWRESEKLPKRPDGRPTAGDIVRRKRAS